MNWMAWSVELQREGRREGHLLVSVSPSGDEVRAPVMVNLALDRSGSMKGAPLSAAIEAVLQLIELAGPDDYVGLLVFDGVAEQRVPLCAMDARGKKQMLEALADVEPGRGTALHQAIELGARQLQRVLVPGRRPKLLLLTDGEPSVGPDAEGSFETLGQRVAEAGISVHALGLARHYVAEILSALTLPSGNGYEHVDGPEGLSVAMGAIFAHLFGEVASQVRVRLTPRGFTALGCRHSFPTAIEDGALVVTMGDVSRGHPRTALFTGALASPDWSVDIQGMGVERGDQRLQRVVVERVGEETESGKFVLALGLELDLVAAETAAWLQLARKDIRRAEAQLVAAEALLRDLACLAAGRIPVRRHLDRLADLRRAVERGEGDIPLLVRRAKSARVGTHVSQVIPIHRAKG